MPIHTHRIFKHLKQGDVFTEEQADRLADALSEMDVASATKDDLDDLEDRLTRRIDRLDDKMATKEELRALKSDLEKRIEESRSTTIRTVVGAVAAVGAILAVVIPLSIHFFG